MSDSDGTSIGNDAPVAEPRVLIVDDLPANLRILSTILRRGGYRPRPVASGSLALRAAEHDPPDLVLLDIQMPEMDGYELCRRLKQSGKLRDIPVIFISAHQETSEKVAAFEAGGIDFVGKPFDEAEVLARVATHLRLRRLKLEVEAHNRELEEKVRHQVQVVTASHLATIFALARLAEARDDDTGRHIERVQTFTRLLALRLRESGAVQLSDAFIDTLHMAASLHDIGKVGIRDAVLLKPGPLTDEEFREMQAHCRLGAETLAEVENRYQENPFVRVGREVARSHHERWDGRGYPDLIAGPAIPLPARIVSVADVYDALTSNRCYRRAFRHEKAVEMIREGSGGQFEPAVVEAFLDREQEFRAIRERMDREEAATREGPP
jgi:putative two-component system response regulator